MLQDRKPNADKKKIISLMVLDAYHVLGKRTLQFCKMEVGNPMYWIGAGPTRKLDTFPTGFVLSLLMWKELQ